MQRSTVLSLVLSLSFLSGCGSEEEAAPTPVAEDEPPVAEDEAVPEPEPEPVEIPRCPENQWGITTGGATQGTSSGVEAAGWVRGMGSSWSSLGVCRTVDGEETQLSCAPVTGGGECELSVGGQHCTATLPRPLLPAVVGQLVDTGEQPSEGTWNCR